jgi:isopenicillin-N epimerase
MDNLKSDFLLNPDIIYLNHGSFGACPKPVFEVYQAWQRKLEYQPVEFLGRRADETMAASRGALADYLGVSSKEVVYFTNPTTAANMIARSLDLQPGDEILTTDHEYGAMDRTWRYICMKSGAIYRRQSISMPISSQAEFIQPFFSGLSEHTRVVFISHITSPTALIIPVKEICHQARQAGLISIVDGAHAPGQIPLDLCDIGADLYIGACHKWLCAPKGTAFLYARPEIQLRLEPLVVSWGYESDNPSNSQFIDYHEWQGTRDLAAFLSVPAAIQYQDEHNWPAIRTFCHDLANQTRQQVDQLTGLEPICPDSPDWFGQMISIRLPADIDTKWLKECLYDDFHIEVPVICWQNQPMVRVSFQAYNDQSDADALVGALEHLLRR